MLRFFKSGPYQDVQLGTLERSWSYWECDYALPPLGTFKLKLCGGRKSPDASSLALACELPARLPSLLSQIEAKLFEHYGPYRDAVISGEEPGDASMAVHIKEAADVWPYVAPVHVLIEPLPGTPMPGTPTIQIAFSAVWDEEHTLGARIQGWRLIELCGSV
jgi:hypothetical protein